MKFIALMNGWFILHTEQGGFFLSLFLFFLSLFLLFSRFAVTKKLCFCFCCYAFRLFVCFVQCVYFYLLCCYCILFVSFVCFLVCIFVFPCVCLFCVFFCVSMCSCYSFGSVYVIFVLFYLLCFTLFKYFRTPPISC